MDQTSLTGAGGAAFEETRRVYNCLKCPGYCCSYPLIQLNKKDVERLAKHFDLNFDDAKKKFTKEDHGVKYALRRKKDEVYGKICRFFDTEERRCTIYSARPSVCRSFPGGTKCGYYDFLKFEREAQDDKTFIALTDHSE